MSLKVSTIICIVLGVIVLAVFVGYYVNNFYTQIKTRMIHPAQKSIAAIEGKVAELEQRVVAGNRQRKTETPVMEMSYRSDATRDGSMSLAYVDVSDETAKRILNNINNEGPPSSSPNRSSKRDVNRTSSSSSRQDPESAKLERTQESESQKMWKSDSPRSPLTEVPRKLPTPPNIFDPSLTSDASYPLQRDSGTFSETKEPEEATTERRTDFSEDFDGVRINPQAVKAISEKLRKGATKAVLSPFSTTPPHLSPVTPRE